MVAPSLGKLTALHKFLELKGHFEAGERDWKKKGEEKEKRKKSDGKDRRTYIRNKFLLMALHRPKIVVPIMVHCCQICVPTKGPVR